ncbi:M6 family metalloprotease domain-containing protein [bacterium]|nr:M6 family metalloprotease domain-containing protein [bacterium]
MHRFTVYLLILLITYSVQAMPPAPGVLDDMKNNNNFETFILNLNGAHNRGMNQPFDFNINQLRRDDNDETDIHVVCILVDFADNEANQDQFSVESFQEMLFSVDEYETGSMRDWYLENSIGEVNIIGNVYGWYRLPHDYAYYVNGQNGWGQFPRNAQGIARDALLAADEDVDFSDYDNSGNGIVEGLFIVHAGPGAESTGSEDDIWSHAWSVPETTLDDVRFERYAMEPENGKIGVFGHELGHSLFGLPDLYDLTNESRGVGNWSMMSTGCWGGDGRTPVHFDAWCKMDAGFITPQEIVENQANIIQEPIETGGEVYITWQEGIINNQYFLLENRQSIGFDCSIPGSGLLIWHIDETQENNNNPWWPGGNNDGHYHVALEQADGSYDLERDNNYGDGNDPWPGIGWHSIFDKNTEPDSRDYSGTSTNITIFNIETSGEKNIRYNISLSDNFLPDELSLFILERIPDNHRYPNPDAENDTTDELTLMRELLTESHIEPLTIGTSLPDNLNEYTAVMYLESWREGDQLPDGLSNDEQLQLTDFLDNGGKLILIGPDITTNLQGDNNPLWSYLHAEYSGEGAPSDEGSIRLMRMADETRFAGMSFPFVQGGVCDHYVDLVSAGEGALPLFNDQRGDPHGLIYTDDNGYRVILQSFLFGGLVDWGGRKADLLKTYFEQLMFYLSAPIDDFTPAAIPDSYILLEAYPNPFNGSTRITYNGLSNGTSLIVFDIAGRRIGRLNVNARSGSTDWHPLDSGLPSGSYWVAPEEANGVSAIRIVYLK